LTTLVSDTAYHSFIGEVEALNTTTIRRLTRSRRHQLLAIALELLGGADNICVSSDFPHFDSSFPEVSSRVLNNKSITPEIGGKILSGGARLYGFTEADFSKAAAAAKRRDNVFAARA